MKTNKTYKFIPEFVSMTDLQRRSKNIVDRVQESSAPYFIVRNNKPSAVIIDIETYEQLKNIKQQYELRDALDSIQEYKKEKSEGKLKTLNGSIYDLWKSAQNENNKN